MQYWDKTVKNLVHPSCLSHLLSVSAATKVAANTGINHLTGSCAGQDVFIVLQIFFSSYPDVKVQYMPAVLNVSRYITYIFYQIFYQNNELSQNAQQSCRMTLLKYKIRKFLIINNEVSTTFSTENNWLLTFPDQGTWAWSHYKPGWQCTPDRWDMLLYKKENKWHLSRRPIKKFSFTKYKLLHLLTWNRFLYLPRLLL